MKKNTHSSGFTLVELLIYVAIAPIILSGILSSYLFFVKSTMSLGNYNDLNTRTRNGLELFGRDMRMVSDVNTTGGTPAADYIMLEIQGANGTTDIVEYIFDDTTKKLIRRSNGNDVTVFEDLTACSLKYFSILDVETVKPIEIKKVQLDATMQRLVQHLENSQHVISARFMMRNKQVTN
jgi:Tfp pilus assembly protein PilW